MTEPAQVNFRYVLALLLMRRKRFRIEETHGADGHDILKIRCVRSGNEYELPNPQLTEDEMLAVQDEVFKVLGWE